MEKKPNLAEGERIISDLMKWLKIQESDSTKNTARRVAKMYLEVFKGLYTKHPKVVTFEANDNYVCVTDIFFSSFCSHHLLPFTGKCGVVYHASNGKVIGISKIPRIVEFWASRPQLQENLTNQIAHDLMNNKILHPKGVYVVMSAEHSCSVIRGIKAVGSKTNTAVILGDIDKEEANNLLGINKFFGRVC